MVETLVSHSEISSEQDFQLRQRLFSVELNRIPLLEMGVHYENSELYLIPGTNGLVIDREKTKIRDGESPRYYSFTFWNISPSLEQFLEAMEQARLSLGENELEKEHYIIVNLARNTETDLSYPARRLEYNNEPLPSLFKRLEELNPLAIRINGANSDFWIDFIYNNAGIITPILNPGAISAAAIGLNPQSAIEEISEEIRAIVDSK